MRKIGAGILLMIILLASCAQPNEIGDGQYNETHSVVSEASFDSAWMEAQQNFRNSYEMDILSSYNVESNYDDLSVGISLFLDFSIDFPFVASIKAGTVLNSEDPDYQELVSMYDEMLLDHQKLCQQTNDYFESQGISGVTVTFTLYANEDELFAEIMNGEVKYELVSEIMNSTPEPRENCDFYNAVYQDTMETIMYYNPMALSAADTVALSGLTIVSAGRKPPFRAG